MYSRGTKIFFAFMVIVLGIGYPLSLLSGFPAFQNLLTGGNGKSATQNLIDSSRAKVRKYHCGDAKIQGKRLSVCADALRQLGAGYVSQATANPQQGQTTAPPDANTKLDKAIAAFEQLHRLRPADDDVTTLLANAYGQRGLYAKAEPLYKYLVKRNPGKPAVLLRLGIAAQSAGDTAEAIADYTKFLKLAPNDPLAPQVKDTLKKLQHPQQPKITTAGGGAAKVGP